MLQLCMWSPCSVCWDMSSARRQGESSLGVVVVVAWLAAVVGVNNTCG